MAITLTPFEVDILRYLEMRDGTATSRNAILGQFGISDGYWQVVAHSLKEHLLIEQDRAYYRRTKLATSALKDFEDHWKHEPFEGRKEW